MKILVTGATGFVGNHLINALLNNPINKNIKIIATSTSKERAKHFDWYNFVNFIEFNYDELTEINYYDFFEKPDLLIHLAWKGLPNYENFNHIENNLLQHYSFLKNIISNGLTNITCVGTCFEYGMVNGEMSCNRVTNPSNYYAIAKDTLRKTLFNLKKDYNFDLKWLRLFYIYGNGQSSTSLYSQLLKSIKSGDEFFNMSKGDQIRDFSEISEVVNQIIELSIKSKGSFIQNICSGYPESVKDFAEKIILKYNSSIKLNLGFYEYNKYEPFAFWGKPHDRLEF